MVKVNVDEISPAYEDVRCDKSSTNWILLTYDDSGSEISLHSKGEDYNECLEQLTNEIRAYVFLRVTTGDELSKRSKFAFITFVGGEVSVIKKAKVSTDKAEVKKVIREFAYETTAFEKSEITLENIIQRVKNAGGANYGTGK